MPHKPSNETSPLLPKLHIHEPTPSGVGVESFDPSKTSHHVRHRRNTTTSGILEDDASGSDLDNNEDGEEEDDGYIRGSDGDEEDDDRNETKKQVNIHKSSLKYASDSEAGPIQPLGLTKRKPRLSGLRTKLGSMTGPVDSSKDVVPQVQGRRNRHRASNFRDFNTTRYWNQLQTEPPVDFPKGRVAAYCTCDQIALFKLLKWLDKVTTEKPMDQSACFFLPGWKKKMYMGVVHSFYRPVNPDDPKKIGLRHKKDAFYFATGCCVFWGLSPEEELQHIQAITSFCTGPVAQVTAEDMDFAYGDTIRVANDAIVLSSDDPVEKLAISFAMAQSAKLDIFEERVEDRIRNTKQIPFNLATTGSIQYSHKDISKLIGQLFIELADVNLHSDILDEPDFFWEDDEYEPLYKRMIKYLDVNNRVRILNKRLDLLRELVGVLNQELTQQHGTKLEWIIIWLLVAEILISVGWDIIVKDLLGYFHR